VFRQGVLLKIEAAIIRILGCLVRKRSEIYGKSIIYICIFLITITEYNLISRNVLRESRSWSSPTSLISLTWRALKVKSSPWTGISLQQKRVDRSKSGCWNCKISCWKVWERSVKFCF